MKCLLTSGVCVCQQDCSGNNIAHNLIIQIYYHPQQEEVIVSNFKTLLDNVDHESMKEMLHTENKFGLRPLEFAAQHGCCEMYQTIMDTSGIYLYKEEVKGLTRYTWYDVTDYEGFHKDVRRDKSPLLLFTFCDETIMKSDGMGKLKKRQYIRQWSHAKLFCNLPFILMLLLLRLTYILCWFVLDMDTSWYDIPEVYIPGNTTSHCRPEYAITISKEALFWLGIYLIIYSVSVILLDIYESTMMFANCQWPLWYTVSGKKSLVTQVLFYRYSNCIFSLFVLIYVIVGLNVNNSEVPFFDYARVFCPALAVWSIMYFIQLLPAIGHFVITVQLMLIDLLHFFIIYGLLVIPFMHSFQIVINSNTNEGCNDAFYDAFNVLYSIFKIMLNMLDVSHFNIRNPRVLYITHMAYTFLVSIMMINFFIALMTNSVNSVSQFRTSALCTQRRAVAFALEKRCIRPFCFMYKIIQRKYYAYDGDKVLLVDTRSSLF